MEKGIVFSTNNAGTIGGLNAKQTNKETKRFKYRLFTKFTWNGS